MRTLRDSRQSKLNILETRRSSLTLILASQKTSLMMANRMRLESTTAVFEEKVHMTRSEIFKLDKKIARLRRKLKEKN